MVCAAIQVKYRLVFILVYHKILLTICSVITLAISGSFSCSKLKSATASKKEELWARPPEFAKLEQSSQIFTHSTLYSLGYSWSLILASLRSTGENSSRVIETKQIKNFPQTRVSGEYPAVVNGATGAKLQVPGASAKGDSDCCRSSRVPAVVKSLAELPWIKRSMYSVRAKIWACNGSRFALIVSSIISGENLKIFSSFRSIVSFATSSIVSSPWADIYRRAFESYVFPLLKVLDEEGKLMRSAKKLIRIWANFFY